MLAGIIVPLSSEPLLTGQPWLGGVAFVPERFVLRVMVTGSDAWWAWWRMGQRQVMCGRPRAELWLEGVGGERAWRQVWADGECVVKDLAGGTGEQVGLGQKSGCGSWGNPEQKAQEGEAAPERDAVDKTEFPRWCPNSGEEEAGSGTT